MSSLGHSADVLRSPPLPVQIARADTGGQAAWEPRSTVARLGRGAVQEASLVGIVALPLSWAAAEAALLLWG